MRLEGRILDYRAAFGIVGIDGIRGSINESRDAKLVSLFEDTLRAIHVVAIRQVLANCLAGREPG